MNETALDSWTVASSEMLGVQASVERLAASDISVVIRGESGVGKERVARALHQRSPRRDFPFVAVNCGAIATGVAESMLFGHERGSFTGAAKRHAGYFETANRGTLFFDEIAELSLGTQAKVLRVLDSKTVVAVGASHELHVDFRLLSASHRDLREMVRRGTFREDLYFRIAGGLIVVPPLRKRREDIVALAQHWCARHTSQSVLSERGLARLMVHAWPGNVRELKSVMALALCNVKGGVVSYDAVHNAISDIGIQRPTSMTDPLEAALVEAGWNVARAARALGIPRTTLRDKLSRRYGKVPPRLHEAS